MDPLKSLILAARSAPLIDSDAEVVKLMPPATSEWRSTLDALRAYVPKTGYTLVEAPSARDLGTFFGIDDEARGATSLDTLTIWLKSEMPDNWKAYVLAHELGHASHTMLWDTSTYYERELFAECVAFLVLHSAVPEWDNTIAPAYIRNQVLGSVIAGKGAPRLFGTEVHAAANAILATIARRGGPSLPLPSAA